MPRTAPKLGGGTATLDTTAFEAQFNMPLVHEAVRAELNARRQGTHATKTRGEVSGGGAKPWRQKGTGRARAGSSRSPVWTGGGTAFGPQPRHYTVKVNRKARRAALRSALSVHAERGSLAVFDASGFDVPSTKRALGLLDGWLSNEASGSTLVLLAEAEANAGLSFRNLAGVAVMPVGDAGVADVIRAATLLVSEAAMPGLVARTAARSADAETVPTSTETVPTSTETVPTSTETAPTSPGAAPPAGADSAAGPAGPDAPAPTSTESAA
jgi:large subunit ribosomal protein L4